MILDEDFERVNPTDNADGLIDTGLPENLMAAYYILQGQLEDKERALHYVLCRRWDINYKELDRVGMAISYCNRVIADLNGIRIQLFDDNIQFMINYFNIGEEDYEHIGGYEIIERLNIHQHRKLREKYKGNYREYMKDELLKALYTPELQELFKLL
jgi:hypothetical protein